MIAILPLLIGVTQCATALEWEPYRLPVASGDSVDAERATLDVPEVRSNPGSKTIHLTVVRLSSSASEPGAPLVYLAGGPGGSAIGSARFPEMWAMYQRIRETRDVILMDQRGTGRSRPALIWAGREPLTADVFLSEDRALAAFLVRSRTAVDAFRQRGIDLSGYTTVESADDLDALRQGLGVEKLALFGFSYGTHLALATMRRHAEHIDCVILAGVEGLAHTSKLPSTYDRQLEKIARIVQDDATIGDALPDVVETWKRILERADREPFVVTVAGPGSKPVELQIGRFGLQWLLARDLGDSNDLPRIPAFLASLERGDTSVLKNWAQRRYNEYSEGISGMSVMVDLASGAGADRRARIEAESATSLFGNVMNFPDFGIAEVWGNPDLGEDYRAAFTSEIRTLFISGTLDCQTPVEQADAIRADFANSDHVIVDYAGHESTLGNSDVQRAILGFLRGERPGLTKASIGLPKFAPIEQ